MENNKSTGKQIHSNRPFLYTTGIVSRLPESLTNKDRSGKPEDDGGFNLELARRQHEKFIMTLRKLKVDLSELDADEERPFCCYLDHMAVVRDGVALIARPGGGTEEEAQVTHHFTQKRYEVNNVIVCVKVGKGDGSLTDERGKLDWPTY